MADKPRFLSKEHRDALAPFAAIIAGAYAMIGELSDGELLQLREACENVSTINCWCMTYDAAGVIADEVSREITKRGLDKPESTEPQA